MLPIGILVYIYDNRNQKKLWLESNKPQVSSNRNLGLFLCPYGKNIQFWIVKFYRNFRIKNAFSRSNVR